MRKVMLTYVIVGALLTACSSDKKEAATDSTKLAANTNVDTAGKPADTAAANKAWAAYMAPSAAHEMLAKSNGKWKAEISFSTAPDAEPYEVACENKMLMGGRYQQSTYKGMMDGMAFEGLSTMGYDNARKVFIGTWIDNMGTGLMYMEGTYDTATKVLNMKGKATDVTTGKEILVRETYKFVDEDTQQLEMFDTKDGKEAKTMSMMLTRVK